MGKKYLEVDQLTTQATGPDPQLLKCFLNNMGPSERKERLKGSDTSIFRRVNMDTVIVPHDQVKGTLLTDP